MHRLDLVVGPNGAGKSTFVRLTLHPLLPASVFVNADEIARHRWPDDPERHAYKAAEIAAQTRDALMGSHRSFIAETVFSHPSKIDLLVRAQDARYIVVVHVLLVPEQLAVLRVGYRVRGGGHSVPEIKIRERFHRLWPLVVMAIELADTATVYDNSDAAGPRVVAQFSEGTPVGDLSWPAWTPDPMTQRWPSEPDTA